MSDPKKTQETLRVAVLGTPCSGADWLAALLAAACDLPAVTADAPADVAWNTLPPGCVLSLPARPTPAVRSQLDGHAFRKVAVVRHPLDVLVSVLHRGAFSQSTERWLDGEGGGERAVAGATPRSLPFLDYASGTRSAALLGAAHAWGETGDCVLARYEDVVEDPAVVLERLLGDWGKAAVKSAAEAAAHAQKAGRPGAVGVPSLGWPELPGLWRTLLPVGEAEALAEAVKSHLVADGYVVNPDPALTERRADENWLRIVAGDLASWQEEARSARQGLTAALRELEQARGELTVLRVRFEMAQRALGEARAHPESPLQGGQDQVRVLMKRLEEAERQLGHARARLKQGVVAPAGAPTEVGPNSLALALKIHNLARRFPRAAGMAKRVLFRRAA